MKKNWNEKPEPLDALPVFRLAARLGSFSRAADRLGISVSAVSQSVRGLEARLGVRLFNRTSRQIALSEAGQTFLDDIGPSLDRLDSAIQQARAGQGQPQGLLRINLSRLAASLLVEPRLADFLQRYPDIRVELFADDALADLVKGGFDAGIRLGRQLNMDMVALPIDRGQRRVVVAAPDYFARHAPPRSPDDLREHDCIRFRLPGSGRLEPWFFQSDGAELAVDVQGRLIFTDDRMATQAARQGLGLTQRFEQSVRADLAAGTLIQVLDRYTPPFPGFHIYYPARRHLPPKLRAFVDFLREAV